MNSIEIITSQHVSIEYKLAPVSARFFAFFIDSVILLILYSIISALFAFAFEPSSLNALVSFIIIGFYTLVSEIIGNGQTLGKKMIGIKVIKSKGNEMEFFDYFARWSMRLIDIYLSLGLVACAVILGNRRGQRLGDILAETTVISINDNQFFTLNEIKKLNDKSEQARDFEYPLITKLTDEDIIVLKKLNKRYKSNPNQAHQEALQLATEKLKTILEINEPKHKGLDFINKVISEYILLTR